MHYVIVVLGNAPERVCGPLPPNVHLVYAEAGAHTSSAVQGLSIHDGLYPLGLPLHRSFAAEVQVYPKCAVRRDMAQAEEMSRVPHSCAAD